MNITNLIRHSNFLVKSRVEKSELLSNINLIVTDDNKQFGQRVDFLIEQEYVPSLGTKVDFSNVSLCKPNEYTLMCDELGSGSVELTHEVSKAIQYNKCLADVIEQSGYQNAGAELKRRTTRLMDATEKDLALTLVKDATLGYEKAGTALAISATSTGDEIYDAILKWDEDLDATNAPVLWSGSTSAVLASNSNEYVFLNEDKGNTPARIMFLDASVYNKVLKTEHFKITGQSQQATNDIYRAGEVFIGNVLVKRSMQAKKDYGYLAYGVVSPLVIAMTKCKTDSVDYIEKQSDKTSATKVEVYDLMTSKVIAGNKLINTLAFVYAKTTTK